MEDKQIIRVFPRHTELTPTDDLAFVCNPKMGLPTNAEVHISCIFTWDIDKAKELAGAWSQYYPVKIGGPAFNTPLNGFVPGRYIRNGVTFTTRGCNNNCSWCFVPEREGKLVEYPDFAVGNIINDNNVLQANASHWHKVIAMLKRQKHIKFSGGLEASRITSSIVDDLRSLRIHELYLACDTESRLTSLIKAMSLLMPYFKRRKLRCYVMIGKDETIDKATNRLMAVWDAGCLPFSQLYQPKDKWIEYSQEWRDLNRNWSRPAITKRIMNGR